MANNYILGTPLTNWVRNVNWVGRRELIFEFGPSLPVRIVESNRNAEMRREQIEQIVDRGEARTRR